MAFGVLKMVMEISKLLRYINVRSRQNQIISKVLSV